MTTTFTNSAAELNALPAADLHSLYLKAGGTKSFKSFKNKAAIINALADAEAAEMERNAITDRFEEHATGDVQPDQVEAEDYIDPDLQYDAHIYDWMEGVKLDEARANNQHERDVRGEEDEPEFPPAGRITEKLSKVQRAKLRKLMGGKLTEGRWTDAIIAVSILEQIGCRYRLTD